MAVQDVSTRDLEAKVSERKAFLIKLIDFIDFIVKNGKMVSRDAHSSHTNVKWELNDFGGFNFHYQSGFSMMGGSGFRILRGGESLLYFEWPSGSGGPRVRFWLSKEDWQVDVEQVIEKRREIVDALKTKTKKKTRQDEKKRDAALRRDELLHEAERLGL